MASLIVLSVILGITALTVIAGYLVWRKLHKEYLESLVPVRTWTDKVNAAWEGEGKEAVVAIAPEYIRHRHVRMYGQTGRDFAAATVRYNAAQDYLRIRR